MEAIDLSAASSLELPTRADDREGEERERERYRHLQSKNLHPCGAQSEGAAVFALPTDWSDFSPLLVGVFLFVLVLNDLGIVGVCVCVCVCVCAALRFYFWKSRRVK